MSELRGPTEAERKQDNKFLAHIVLDIVDYARSVGQDPDETLKTTRDLVIEAIQMAIEALGEQKWVPCEPSELPKGRKLWVTHYNHGCIYVDELFWDMTEWSDNVSDVVAYMPHTEPEPYREDEYEQ